MTKIFSIAPQYPFVDALAAGLLDRTTADPAALADMLVLLPTRRACRSLREAFLRQTEGKALLLPRMRPVGDVDEEELVLSAPVLGPSGDSEAALTELLSLPPAISETERLLRLTELVKALRNAQAEADPALDRIGPDQALLLARELARLLNQIQTEGLTLDQVETLVPEAYAEHWAQTVAFLNILRTQWPAYLEASGEIDAADRRNRLMQAQAEAWRAKPPNYPVIAAGSTGSIPSTATLITTIANLPRGMVVLPGLDRHLEEEAWPHVAEDPTHPQYGLAQLLEKLGTTRDAVLDWSAPGYSGSETGEETSTGRVRLIAEALRPAKTTDRWHDLTGLDEAAFDGLEWLAAPSPAAEAGLAAQCLREALETPGKTAALVTPDRMLARRVAAQMDRWGIRIDDSAGRPLSQTEAGRFFRLTAEAVSVSLGPVGLLSLLKHPMAALGGKPIDLRHAVRTLEIAGLRGPKPAAGPEGIRRALEARRGDRHGPGEDMIDQALVTLDAVEAALSPLLLALKAPEVTFDALLTAHIQAAEALAKREGAEGAEILWRGDDGEELAGFIADLTPYATLLGSVGIGDYVALIDALMQGKTVRPRMGAHPRVSILGPLEARLQHADRVVLAGLNEGVWPPDPGDDPWMSRDMRKQFGLPAHERRIGLAAHDFAQACAAPEVILLRAEKNAGQQTVPARWLERLATVTERLGLDGMLPRYNGRTGIRLSWQNQLDRRDRLPVINPPMPRPPVDVRPLRLSATRIETLMQDPYSIFAGNILRLQKLDPLEADLGASDKGMMIHEALDRFMRQFPNHVPPDAVVHLLRYGEEAFGAEALARPAVKAFWWPRFERIAQWFVEREEERRPGLTVSHSEIKGEMKIPLSRGEFTLSAEADRIDRRRDGGYAILDYKTGYMPSKTKVKDLAAPQLPLEAAILKAGGFKDVEPGEIVELAYWKLSGGEPAGAIQVSDDGRADELAEEVRIRLVGLIEGYEDPETAYPAVPRPGMAPRFNDYEHLARIKEWSLGGEGGE